MKKYYWSGISQEDRIKTMGEITGIINNYATILNFQRFSDISLSLVLEVEEGNLYELHSSLKKIMSMEALDLHLTGAKTEGIVLLNITFPKGTGDLEIEVPDIPE